MIALPGLTRFMWKILEILNDLAKAIEKRYNKMRKQ